ncbi:MAG: isoprenyl transferase [Bacilli bacterium]|jgi:undecaprenyl diphosphate synthase|nr:isoprenyl transferase [Bacilli bacterium]MDY0209091.1 isoprenyl transferase [Bacilli bacterium]
MNDAKERLPGHIAIIMDGNGTWAKKRGLPRNFGHRKGVQTLINTVKYCQQIGIEYLTVFAFSTENWSRPKEEVDYLMKLPEQFLESYRQTMRDNGVKLRVIGRKDNLGEKLLQKIIEVERETMNNSNINFTIAFNYGGKDEILNATKHIAMALKEDKIKLNDINEKLFYDYLYTKDLPVVDLLIRTSNQIRISNFLLWQIAYSELYFTDVLWPDFRRRDLDKAIDEYKNRNRRFGGLK